MTLQNDRYSYRLIWSDGNKTTLAFLNADWRNFEFTPAAEEKPAKAIIMIDLAG